MLIALLALTAGLACAANLPDCAHLPGDAAHDQPSLDDVMACQQATREVWNALDPRPAAADWDRLDSAQRAEVKAYMDRHPNAAQAAAGNAADNKEPQAASLGGLTQDDLGRVDPQTAQALGELQTMLQGQSAGGSKGIDPQMAKEISGFLSKEQGGASPEMQSLLEAVGKEGPNLSAETMQKLQDAARAGKAAGLDLNIAPATEKSLLNDDFKKEEKPSVGDPQSLPYF